MFHHRFRSLAALLLFAALPACGGDEASPGGPIAGAPTPTPSPTSSSAFYPPAPTGTTGPVIYDLFGWVDYNYADRIEPTRPDLVSFGWDGNRYNLDIDEVGSGRLRYFFGPMDNPSAYLIERPGGEVIPVGITIAGLTTIASSPRQIYWEYPVSRTTTPTVTHSGDVVAGYATAQLPSAGSRAYVYDNVDGEARFDVNFATGDISGQLQVALTGPWGPYAKQPATIQDLQLNRAERTFSGIFTVPNGTETLMFEGRFFGADASHVALRLRGNLPDVTYLGPPVPFRYVWIMSDTN